MKFSKFIVLLSAALAAVVAAVSCQKEEGSASVPEPAGKVEICITGDFNDFDGLDTKASIENIFRMTWAANDKVYVYGKESGASGPSGESLFICLGTLTAEPDSETGNRVADLTGTITAPKADTKLTLVYSPLLTSAPEVADGAISIDLSNQSGGASDVTFVAYTAVDYKGATDATYRTSFSFATSVLRVNVADLSASTALTKATLGQIETSCKLTFAEAAKPTVEGETSGTITRTLTDCSASTKGTAAFYIAVPAITANAARKLTVTQQNEFRTEYSGFAAGAKDAGKMMNSIARMEYGLCDLSLYGTANCYIVPGIGNYKFNATVKGNSTQDADKITPTSVKVLWESFGTAVTPTVGDLVKNVTLADGYVTFTATDKKGNAVIAAKDGSGKILWSWHIWLTDAPSVQTYNNNAGKMMDRSLGAISAAAGADGSCGLLYQWGRKDPFIGGSGKTTAAVSTPSNPTAFEPASSHLSDNNTLAYSIANPTTFICNFSFDYSIQRNDWYCTNYSYKNDTLWRHSVTPYKTIYDPCPVGYRVPDGGSNGVWSTAFGSSSYYINGPWYGTNKGMNFGSGNGQSSNHQLGSASTIWYPATGYRKSIDGSLINVGNYGYYWSCTPLGNHAYELYFGSDGYVNPSYDSYRAFGQSVRCLSESK